jgi:hypothetical protein
LITLYRAVGFGFRVTFMCSRLPASAGPRPAVPELGSDGGVSRQLLCGLALVNQRIDSLGVGGERLFYFFESTRKGMN